MKTIENTSVDAINTLEDTDENLKLENQLLRQRNEELEEKIRHYEEYFRVYKHKQFGASSEKSNPEQVSFFNEAEKLSAQVSEEPNLDEVISKRRIGKSKTKKSYEDLPVEEIHYTLSEDETHCPKCDHDLHEMKTEIRKELKVIPPQVKVIHHVKHVYACRNCDVNGESGTIITAPAPKPILPGSMASPSLVAFIMEKKYNQALPLYRQEGAFINYGLDVSRQNMANWIINSANNWLRLIYDRLHEYLLSEAVIHADESVLQVLDDPKKGNNYMWLYATAKTANHNICLYDYQPSRSQKHPKEFLKGFGGFLQTDGYDGYNAVENITRVGCMAHARRKFNDVLKALPKDARVSDTKTQEALNFFKKLYTIEGKCKDLTPEERFEVRQAESGPILDEFRQWLSETNALPKSKFGEAVKYAVKQWPNLTAYMKDGKVAIDNNLAERAIKNFVIGRKNYLFCKSPKGATASAISYSIIVTAKQNGLNPFEYLKYLFEQLPNVDVKNPAVLDALLPWSESLPEEIKRKPENDE